MATTKNVSRTPSGRLTYRGESFAGYNKPKRTSGGSKKFAVLAKKGDEVKLVRFGDPNMTIKKSNPERRRNFRARHNCDTAKDKFSARYWSCKKWSIALIGSILALGSAQEAATYGTLEVCRALL
jgi:hypothetical protein